MISYTAIYDFKDLKEFCYSFKCDNDNEAIEFCNLKFNKGLKIKLVDNTGESDCKKGRLVSEFVNK